MPPLFNADRDAALRSRNVPQENAGPYKASVLLTQTTGANYRATARGGRPPPWLALPPLLAISRCFAGSIAAKPRFDPLVVVAAIMGLPHISEQHCNAIFRRRFTFLIQVSELLFETLGS